MEGWDLDKVKALKAQYEAAGVTTTSSYNFLSSIVHAGTPPRGRGITWLQQLLEQGAQPAVVGVGQHLALDAPQQLAADVVEVHQVRLRPGGVEGEAGKVEPQRRDRAGAG